jgi:hypothetical protein
LLTNQYFLILQKELVAASTLVMMSTLFMIERFQYLTLKNDKFAILTLAFACATLEYISRIKSLAIDFPSMAVVLRMKLLYESDRSMIKKYFTGIDNFLLCDDYFQGVVSYAICKEASVIVAVQTSLADECLAIGKKVVLIDSTHNIRGLFKDIYPQDFQFAIADGSKEINAIVTRCLNGDPELSAQYQELSSKLSGDFDLTIPNAIPKALEIYLQ